ncbi:MAG: EAL domain-containing protein [Pseudomonadaceae bacterium]|nr:EAL domain-containing protein [Pseudomonadaceae bacterium]
MQYLQACLLTAIVEKIPHAVIVTDHAHNIIYVNPAYEYLTGLSKQEVLGKTPRINQSGHHDAAFYKSLQAELDKTGHWEGDVWDFLPNGRSYLKHLSIKALADFKGEVSYYFAIFSELSTLHRNEAELERLTHYDPLTDLPNRILFRNRLGHEFNISSRHNTRTGLILLNVDRFKLINDTFGFAAGDQLLVDVAVRLCGGIRRTDLLARQESRQERDADMLSRMGGNDFSFILSELRKPDDASIVAERILSCLEAPFTVQGEEIYVSASLGLAIYPDNAQDEDSLLQCAESALNQVKAEGRGGYRFFSDDLNIRSAFRVRLEAKMRKALQQESFVLYYQPKQDLKTGKITGMEALLRWPTDEGMISPEDFIPLAEDTGMINPLGRWILFRALLDTVEASKQVGYPLQVAVNLSMRQFQRPGLRELVTEAITFSGIDPTQVELEITESMVMDKVDEAIATMQSLRDLGVQLAIDDFGTGYSSMAYLRNFPVNTLKIDQTFVKDLVAEDSNSSIIEAVIGLGRGLGMKVVAEGVETQLQLDFLKRAGCHLGQGYYIGHPLALDAFVEAINTSD